MRPGHGAFETVHTQDSTVGDRQGRAAYFTIWVIGTRLLIAGGVDESRPESIPSLQGIAREGPDVARDVTDNTESRYEEENDAEDAPPAHKI